MIALVLTHLNQPWGFIPADPGRSVYNLSGGLVASVVFVHQTPYYAKGLPRFFYLYLIVVFSNISFLDFLNFFIFHFPSFTPPCLVDRFLDPRKVVFYPSIYCHWVPSGTAFPPIHLDRRQLRSMKIKAEPGQLAPLFRPPWCTKDPLSPLDKSRCLPRLAVNRKLRQF